MAWRRHLLYAAARARHPNELGGSIDPAKGPRISRQDLRYGQPRTLGEGLFNYWDRLHTSSRLSYAPRRQAVRSPVGRNEMIDRHPDLPRIVRGVPRISLDKRSHVRRRSKTDRDGAVAAL